MPIIFNEQHSLFKLDTKDSSYIIKIYDGGYLLHLYYGRKIPDDVVEGFDIRPRNASFSPVDKSMVGGDFAPDAAPIEYGTDGAGDYRISAIKARNYHGDSVTDLRYKSHKIYAGKPFIADMPATYCENDEATTLELVTEDKVTGLETTLVYTVFEKTSVMTKSVRVKNTSQNAMFLERVFSLCNDFNSMEFDLITLYGRHYEERHIERRALAHGVQGVESGRGVSSHCQNPFVALVSKDADEDHGEAYGFNLVYSGNFSALVECDYNDSSRLIMGINPNNFTWKLEPNEIFYAPEAVCVYSHDGIGEMSRIFHRFYNRHLINGKYQYQKRPILINSWEAAYFDINSEKLLDFARTAKEIGIELLVMDDGWFGHRNDDTTSLGDWFVNKEKFPNGLTPFIDEVHKIGLKFGIWFEPEMISPDSEFFKEHPDYCVHATGREPLLGRAQYVLDVSRADVRDALWAQLDAILSKNKIDYVKWDFNRYITDADSVALPAERKKEFSHRFILGTYDLMNRLKSKYPEILLENCCGGGGRFDPAMLYYSPQIWTSDNTDAMDRLFIQFGTSLCYPASSMGAHVSAYHPNVFYGTKASVALWGSFGYELDVTKLTNEQKEEFKKQIAEYHKYYDLIHYGDLYRVLPPTSENLKVAWEFVSEDKSECLLTIICVKEHIPENFVFKFKGLDVNAYYQDEESGKIYSGALLTYVGLNLSNQINYTYGSKKWYLKKVDNK
ncbi:MAG: alpha-galactosidase [Clostridia bacterium]|nr:alpha-galactosidase [Clostridia bacterium]